MARDSLFAVFPGSLVIDAVATVAQEFCPGSVALPVSASAVMPTPWKQLSISSLFGGTPPKVVGPAVVITDSPVKKQVVEVLDSQSPVLRNSGNRGGRPAKAVKRGRLGGESTSNRRELWQQELRCEPTLPVKLALAAKIESLVKKFGSRTDVPSLDRVNLETEGGWA